jgi:hypothetical protein
MLRSSAAQRERKCFHRRAPLRCVSKHEAECTGSSSSFETRARAFEAAAPLRYRAPQDEDDTVPYTLFLIEARASVLRYARVINAAMPGA